MADELLKELAKSDAEMEDQYLSQIFADDEEIESIQALAAERSAEMFENCRTKEEFEALVGREA